MFPVAVISATIIKLKKLSIAMSFITPAIVFLLLPLFLGGLLFYNDLKYYKNPLADTDVSKSFKPLNVPLLKEGMSETEVLELLGEPLKKLSDKWIFAEEGKNSRGWYDYFCLDVEFKDGIAVKINKSWEYED